MGELNGSVSLAERWLVMFVIGQMYGRRITVRAPILWDTHQFTTLLNQVDKTETLLGARIHDIRGFKFLL